MTAPARHILVAVDGSTGSLQAGRFAITLAPGLNAALRAIAVLGKERGARLVDKAGGAGASGRERRRATLEDALAHFSRSAQAAGVSAETVLRAVGVEAYEAIMDEVDRWPADLLVVGRGGHRGIGRVLLGSQTEHLLEFAAVPVVVVPARGT